MCALVCVYACVCTCVYACVCMCVYACVCVCVCGVGGIPHLMLLAYYIAVARFGSKSLRIFRVILQKKQVEQHTVSTPLHPLGTAVVE